MEHRQEREKKPRMIITVWGWSQLKHSTISVRDRVSMSHMLPGTKVDDNNGDTHTYDSLNKNVSTELVTCHTRPKNSATAATLTRMRAEEGLSILICYY